MIVRCEKCGGNVEVARLRTRGQEVELAGVFTPGITPVEARVCTTCGYTELYAARPGELSRPDITAEPPIAAFDE